MTAKQPTPQGISALLNRSGFQHGRAAVRGGRAGYIVSRHLSTGNVRVEHVTLSMGSPDRVVSAALAKYAKAITDAGYAVLTPSPRWIVVTAGESS